MHSKLATPDEIFSFMKEWGNRCPVVIVPTKYYSTPTPQFKEHGVSTVIWANHLMRSAVKSMQDTAKTIFEQQSLVDVEEKVVTVKEVFRLQNDAELEEAEKKYFQKNEGANAIILAASRGGELGDLTIDRPKTLIQVNGTSLLEQMVSKIRETGINNINVIRGYKKDVFPELGVQYFDNDLFDSTGELSSLNVALDKINGECLISYGDIVYKKYILNLLKDSNADISIIVDSKLGNRTKDYAGDFVECSEEDGHGFSQGTTTLLRTSLAKMNDCSLKIMGEWIGLLRANEAGSMAIQKAMKELSQKENFHAMKMGDLLNHLIANGNKIGVNYIQGHWMDIDNFKDFEKVQVF